MIDEAKVSIYKFQLNSTKYIPTWQYLNRISNG
jgi:hypothetical protein